MRDVEGRQRGYKYYKAVPPRARGGSGMAGMIGRSLLREGSDSRSRIVPSMNREAMKADSKLPVVSTSGRKRSIERRRREIGGGMRKGQ